MKPDAPEILLDPLATTRRTFRLRYQCRSHSTEANMPAHHLMQVAKDPCAFTATFVEHVWDMLMLHLSGNTWNCIHTYMCVCDIYDIWFMYIWYILGIRDRGGYTIYQCEFLPWWWNAQRTFASAAPPWRFHPGVDLIMSLHGQKLLCLCTCSHTSYGIYIYILHLSLQHHTSM